MKGIGPGAVRRIAATLGLALALIACTTAAAQAVRLSGTFTVDGEPLAGVAVTTEWGGDPQAVTGADGAFSIERPTGHTVFEFRTEGDGGYRGLATFTLDGDRHLDLELPRRHPLTVRVIGLQDEPIADARLRMPISQVTTDLGGDLPGTTLGVAQGVAFTNAAGEASFLSIPAANQTGPGSIWAPAGSPYIDSDFNYDERDADEDGLVVHRLTNADTTPPELGWCWNDQPGWHAGNVTVDCWVSDEGRGFPLDSTLPPFELQVSVSTNVAEGRESAAAYTEPVQACDLAGLCTTVGPFGPYRVDRAAPRVGGSIPTLPAPRAGWWKVPRVTLKPSATDISLASFACTLDGTPVRLPLQRDPGTWSGTFYVQGEGRHVASCTAADQLGRVSTLDHDVRIDLHGPYAPTASPDRAPEHAGGGGWFRDAVTVAFADAGDRPLADGTPGSGVDPASVPEPITVARSGRTQVTGTVRDLAGNLSPQRTLLVRVDADPPRSTLTCPQQPVPLGRRAVATWQDADDQSGLANAATGTVAIDTSAPGAVTVEHVATDRVGHTTRSTCTAQVAAG